MRTWEDCVAFHGHECGGLAIGYKAALYAAELLELTFSDDEQVVCIAENNACGIDAISVMLGCTLGKGNLILQVVGKTAYSFYNRKTGQAVRLVLNPLSIPRQESLAYFRANAPQALFTVKPVTRALPQKAQLYENFVCDCCGESAAEAWCTQIDGKKLCADCAAALSESSFS
jgi:formylmethanofuran dehydrogenase subunit E